MTPQAPAASNRSRDYAVFTERIERLCRTDPGARAALRAGLRRDLDHPRTRAMHRLLTLRLPQGCNDRTAQAHYTVASLIAAQPRHAYTWDDEEGQDTAEEEEEAAATKQDSREKAEPDEAAVPPARASYGTSFGAALGHAAMAKGAPMRMSAAESRVNLLTRQSLRGIHLHLPAAVNQVRTTGTAIDWGQLLADLVDWPYQSGRIGRRWLQDFYRITADVDQA